MRSPAARAGKLEGDHDGRAHRVEQAAWRTFLRAHAQLVRRLEGELVAEHDLPLPSYDVLVQLSEAPAGGCA